LKGTEMILKPEFANMVDRMGLEDGELSLAEIVWEKAERAMQGKPTQEAFLLKSAHYNPTSPYALTQDEIQSLTTGLAAVLRNDEEVLAILKRDIDTLWRYSDPDNADTATVFDRMNVLRNTQRRVKKDHAKLARIQHKLKKQKSK
jgi:hypothetical protein